MRDKSSLRLIDKIKRPKTNKKITKKTKVNF